MGTKHILLSAWFGTRNTGDQAILLSLVHSIRSSAVDAEITVLTKNQSNDLIDKLELEKISNKLTNIINIFRAIKSADIVIMGGGGLLQEETSYFTIFQHAYKLLIAGALKKKILMISLGTEEIKTLPNRLLTKKILDYTRRITVRDRESYNALLHVDKSISDKIEVTADCVLNMPPSNSRTSSSKTRIGLCLRDWFIFKRFLSVSTCRKINSLHRNKRYHDFIRRMSALVERLQSLGYEISFVPFEGKSDETVAVHIQQILKKKMTVRPWNPDPMQMLSYTAEMDLVIGMRLHSLIFGAVQGKKLISINYSDKVKSFMDSLGLFENQFSPNFQIEEMVQAVQRELSQKGIAYTDQLETLKFFEKRNHELLRQMLLD